MAGQEEMNRRSFLKLIGLASVAPTALIPAEPLIAGELGALNGVRWKVSMQARILNDDFVGVVKVA